MTTMRLATVQLMLQPEPTVEGFLEHLDRLTRLAAGQGAHCVVFPELASTGLLGSIEDHQVTSQTIRSDYWNVLSGLFDQIVDGVRSISRSHDVIVLGGSHIRLAEDGSLRNTAVLCHPDGTFVAQDKMHLTPQEHQLGMRGGDVIALTRIGPFTAGILICADIQFPELSRYLVAKGADLILCPSLTWNRRGVHRVRTGCSARAIENQLYVVMSPLIGSDGLPADAPMYAAGAALVATPVDRTLGLNDGLLGTLDGTEEAVLIVDLDHDKLLVSRATPEAPGLALQRPDLYAALRAEVAGR